MRKKFPKRPDSCLHEERRLENFFHRAKPESERERSGGELGELAPGEIGERERTAAKAIQLEEDS